MFLEKKLLYILRETVMGSCMRCTYDLWTENRPLRYLRRFWGYEAEIFSESALTYSPKIEEKKFQQMLFFGRYGRKFRQHWILEVAKIPPFFHIFGQISAISGWKKCLFFLEPFWTYSATKKNFWGVSAIFRLFGAFSPKTTNFPKISANFANFWSKLRFLCFFSKFQVEISSGVLITRTGLMYEKGSKIFEKFGKF